jgi:hypothetical protein
VNSDKIKYMQKLLSKKIKNGIIFSLILVISLSFNSSFALAETIVSPSYKIEGLTFGADGGADLNSANFRLNLSAGGNLNDVKLQSTSYKVGAGVKSVLQANIPQLACFESTTSASTDCTDPAVVPNGMEQVCGFGGCFNKARFEIDAQGNPTDTLYSVQITTDAGWGSWNYVDGTSRFIESVANHDIDDYLTESVWESGAGVFNIVGLDPAVTYYLRITALRGDFTESGYSNVLSSTTGVATTSFNVLVADENEMATTDIDLGTMSYGTVAVGDNFIWLYLGTNASGGAGIYVRDLYSGLRSISTAFTIDSVSSDLSSNIGYGLQNRTSVQDNLGPIIPSLMYNLGGEIVGIVENDLAANLIYSTSNKPVLNGKTSLYVKANPAEAAPSVTDYTDTLYFTVASSL